LEKSILSSSQGKLCIYVKQCLNILLLMILTGTVNASTDDYSIHTAYSSIFYLNRKRYWQV